MPWIGSGPRRTRASGGSTESRRPGRAGSPALRLRIARDAAVAAPSDGFPPRCLRALAGLRRSSGVPSRTRTRGAPIRAPVIAALLIGAFAFGVSLLTLVSGFGLGTLLMPAFALFLPVQLAVASTALVHAANNLLKAGLLVGRARRDVLLRFGLPAIATAFVGAALLGRLSAQAPLASWTFLGRQATLTPVKCVMGLLIVGFGAFELAPLRRPLRASTRWLPLGGALSGFFGGLSGHQGALRAIFLSPVGLSAGEFAATQACLALLVDVARIGVYGVDLATGDATAADSALPWRLVAAASVGALAGALLGARWLPRVSVAGLHQITGALLLTVGIALAVGIA
jgi:uncharacterized protein